MILKTWVDKSLDLDDDIFVLVAYNHEQIAKEQISDQSIPAWGIVGSPVLNAKRYRLWLM